MRAESAVEPTRSENMTVTWRRSAAVSLEGGVVVSKAAKGASAALGRDCVEERTAMPNDGYAQILQILRREARKELFRNGVLAEGSLVLFEAKAPQPHCQIHDSALIAFGRMIGRAKKMSSHALA